MAQEQIPTSGLWSALAGLINDNFTELFTTTAHEHTGIYDYNHAGADLSLTVDDTWYSIPNDGAGPFTNKTYALSDVADVWNTSTNLFDFSGLELGDSIDIRLDVTGTTTGPNQNIGIDMFLGIGGSEYQIPFLAVQQIKNAGAHHVVLHNSIYLGDDNTRNNPAVFKIRSDDDATIAINGWFVRVIKHGTPA